ncbi:MAG: type II toxin-antitoxin system RelE/ParE family toxin [Bacteroidota bacterium]
MKREIVFHGDYFMDFYKSLDDQVKMKIKYVFELIKQVERIPVKFLAALTASEGLFEIRIEYPSNIFRIFCCFDQDRLVVLFNGFQKKTQKTPKEEIDRAMRLRNEYFQLKNQKS